MYICIDIHIPCCAFSPRAEVLWLELWLRVAAPHGDDQAKFLHQASRCIAFFALCELYGNCMEIVWKLYGNCMEILETS